MQVNHREEAEQALRNAHQAMDGVRAHPGGWQPYYAEAQAWAAISTAHSVMAEPEQLVGMKMTEGERIGVFTRLTHAARLAMPKSKAL